MPHPLTTPPTTHSYQDAVEFIENMLACVPVTTQLLGSKVTSDILESLEFLAVCHEFKLEGAHEGLRKALALVWSSEAAVKSAVVNVYVRLYLTADETTPPKQRAASVVQNLFSLVQGATVGELTSLEELLQQLMAAGHISKPVIDMLLDLVSGKFVISSGAASTDRSSALLLLAMASQADREIVSSNLSLLVQHGLSGDLLLAKNCCLALQRMADRKGHTGVARLPATHQLFARLSDLLRDHISNMATQLWCPFAEKAVNTMYCLCEQPQVVCEAILKAVCPPVLGEQGHHQGECSPLFSVDITADPSTVDCEYPVLLSRLFFLAGHIMKEQVIHLEVSVLKEMKRRRQEQQERTATSSMSTSGGRDKRSKNNKNQVHLPLLPHPSLILLLFLFLVPV